MDAELDDLLTPLPPGGLAERAARPCSAVSMGPAAWLHCSDRMSFFALQGSIPCSCKSNFCSSRFCLAALSDSHG